MKHNHKIFIFIWLILTLVSNNSNACSGAVFSTDIVRSSTLQFDSNTVFKQELNDTIIKFENLNIKVAHQDFNRLIENNKNNDFLLVLLADKTAELGFFDLSNIASSKIKDVEISHLNIDNIRKFYFPCKDIDSTDIIILAELYSNITYNDLAKESIDELINTPRLLKKYDYANYLIALAYFNMNDSLNAEHYIDIATAINPNNINYQILKSKIFAKNKKEKIALKNIKKIDLAGISYYSLSNKIVASKEYVSYLLASKEFDKNFHLGMYYFQEGDYIKASRIFQSGVTKNKKQNAKLYGMLSRCYFNLGDTDKAKDYANKACKINYNTNAVLTLGNIESFNGNYKSSIKYYKDASTDKSLRQECFEKIASSYIKLSNTKHGNEIYLNLIKECDKSYLAHYKLANYNNDIDGLKKSVSINLLFQDGWIDLARIMIESGNLELAKTYLLYASYIDDNNFRCFYYKGLLDKKESEIRLKNSKKDNTNIAGTVSSEV